VPILPSGDTSPMACSACAKRRKRLLAKRQDSKAKGKHVQAAALDVVLGATGLVGKLIGEEDGNRDSGITEPTGTGSREDR
jgi:hypothetical protein